ncbi:MBL fold metallo-hydrolase [Planotetraspora silvatica]|uniref:MBL fold metallo-hydrolase n=1 Tax=Planotetraspora silvatica TaxID=234614 RepID=UPI001950AA4E|nr:MBL fold metallo-hydrolase [Planotetraspora silvatica]
MTDRIGPTRHRCAVTVLGGPTTVIDIGGLRIIADPTFDDPGQKAYLTKLTGPAASETDVGPVDAALVSHDLHPDNLDERGRAFALAAPVLLTGPVSARRLGPPAVGLAPWTTHELPRADGGGLLEVRALPAVHGPQDGVRDEDGHVNCEVTGFLLSGQDLPTVYVSGDNASMGAVAEIARRVGPVDVAVLFIGGARVPAKERGRPLTLTSERAAAAAAVLDAPIVIPAHYDGWAHFSEGHAEIDRAFDDAGLTSRLRVADHGEWTALTP